MVGPQGSGKSTLIRAIVAAAPDRLASCDWEAAHLLSNDDIRATVGPDVVFVEALELGARHRDLQPGDAVLQFAELIGTDGAPAVPAEEARDAA